ncbi:hypothetical protein [Vulcanisaeta sp. JCM 16161]|nr:hypothetical protein [Vulcanisaeta sp. JCM 16161]
MDLDELSLSVMGPLILRLRNTRIYERLEKSLASSLSFTSLSVTWRGFYS